MSDVRVVINNHIIPNVADLVRTNAGRRTADSCEIKIIATLRGLQLKMPVLISYDKISLSGTVGLWACEQNINDASGYENHGSVTGSGSLSYETGYAGRCWRFVNDDTVVTIPHSDSFDFSEQWDISMWIKPVDVSREQVIFSYLANSSDKLELFIRGGILGVNISRLTATFSSLTLQPDKWHHIRAAQVSATKIKLWVNDNVYEVSVPRWWDDTRTDANITLGGGNGISTTGNVYYAGLMDLVRLKCGSIISQTDHRLILHSNEPAEFARFGGRIQKFDHETGITHVTALSYAADMHDDQVIYESTNNLDIVEALINMINDHTQLTATYDSLTGIILGTVYFNGKIIDIIQEYLDGTGFTFSSDPFGGIRFFKSTNRQIPIGYVHGKNADVISIESNDETVKNKIILDGGGTDENFQDPNARTRTAIFYHRVYNINPFSFRAVDLPTLAAVALATEQTLKGAVRLLGNIQSVQEVVIGFNPSMVNYIRSINRYNVGGRAYYSRLDEWLNSPSNYVLTDSDYTFTGDTFKINNTYRWPTATASLIRYLSGAGYVIGGGHYPANIPNMKSNSAAHGSVTTFFSNQAVKPHIVRIRYTYFVEQGVNPGPKPHQIAQSNRLLPTTKTIRKSVPYLVTQQDKERYLTWYLINHHKVNPSIKVIAYNFAEPVRPGDIVHVTKHHNDPKLRIDSDYIIYSTKSRYPANVTEMELGEYRGDFITSMQSISRRLQDINTRVNNYSQHIRSVDLIVKEPDPRPTITITDN